MKNTDMGRTSVANDDGDQHATVSDEELTRVEAGMGLDLQDVSTLFTIFNKAYMSYYARMLTKTIVCDDGDDRIRSQAAGLYRSKRRLR